MHGEITIIIDRVWFAIRGNYFEGVVSFKAIKIFLYFDGVWNRISDLEICEICDIASASLENDDFEKKKRVNLA